MRRAQEMFERLFHHSCAPAGRSPYVCPFCERVWAQKRGEGGAWWSEHPENRPVLATVTVAFADGRTRTWHPGTEI